jgi:hypothetical protein
VQQMPTPFGRRFIRLSTWHSRRIPPSNNLAEWKGMS